MNVNSVVYVIQILVYKSYTNTWVLLNQNMYPRGKAMGATFELFSSHFPTFMVYDFKV